MSSLRSISDSIKGDSKAGSPQSTRMVSTDMDDTVSVFGGAGLLEEKIREVVMDGYKNIFIVTTCVPGIIGDNTIDVVNAISLEHPDIYFRVVESDGNITGDWEDGFIQSADALLDMVDGSVEAREDTVNIMAERYFFKRGEEKDREVIDLFNKYGIKVNCRFMYNSSMDSIRKFRLGKVNYIIDNDHSSLKTAELVRDRLGVKVDMEPLPAGVEEYKKFSEKIGKEFGIQEKAAKIAAEDVADYNREIERIKPRFEGKKVMIENKIAQDIDWLMDLITDLGMEIVIVEVWPCYQWKEKKPESKYLSKGIRYRYDCSLKDIISDIEEYSPDIILSDSVHSDLEGAYQATYSRPGPGIKGIIDYAKRLEEAISLPKREGWRNI